MNFTDKNENIIAIVEYNGNNIDSYIKDYTQRKSVDGQEVTVTEKTINNIKLKKSVDNNDSEIVHYWFLNNKNNKVYEIYTWNASSNFDNNVEVIINSMSFSFF